MTTRFHCAGTSGTSLTVSDWPHEEIGTHTVAQISYCEGNTVKTVCIRKRDLPRLIATLTSLAEPTP